MERRLAAILAADVVDYSRLMGEDEARMIAALRRFRIETFEPFVREHHGRLVKNMGDGWLVELKSIASAVECALMIQNEMSDDEIIKLRIGVHIGDVTFDDNDIFGDGVNVAARLEAIARPGEVLISDTAHNSLDGKAAAHFGGGELHELKNIARPVVVWRWPADAGKQVANSSGRERHTVPERPSIAVLPFDNMSGDSEQEYFSDGIAEDIITDLSKFSWLMVVARNSSFSFKGQAMDLREVARELGVRYVLEGSVRKSGSRVRVTAQLIDANDGSHIWAERYNRQLEDIFDLQDEMTESITTAIAPELEKFELSRARKKRPDSLDAWDIVLRARSLSALMSKDSVAEARRLAEQALELQPAYGEALSVIALCYGRDAFLSWSGDRKENAEKAVRTAHEALKENSNDTTAFVARSMGEMTLGLHDEAVQTMRQCVRVNSNDHTGHRGLASALARRGDYVEAIHEAEISMTLSPRDPNSFVAYFDLAYAHLANGNAVEARKWTEKLGQEFPHHSGARQVGAAVYVALGEVELAKKEMALYLASEPGATIGTMRERFTFRDPDFRERYFSSLRLTGMPEE